MSKNIFPEEIYLAADHGGFNLKEEMYLYLTELLIDRQLSSHCKVINCEAKKLDMDDDYPIIVSKICSKIKKSPQAVGIIFCRSGTGVAMAANKFTGIRAGNCFTPEHTAASVSHNHLNILCLPADYVNPQEIKLIIESFLTTKPSTNIRHLRRLAQIAQIEEQCGSAI